MYLDVTTPFLRDAAGTAELDTEVFLSSLPWLLRPVVRRLVVPGILDRYHRPRVVLLDLAANLLREGLDGLVPVAVEACEGRVSPALHDDESYEIAVSDAEVRVRARSETGLLFALETLRQLVQREQGRWGLPHLVLRDRPRYPWRACAEAHAALYREVLS